MNMTVKELSDELGTYEKKIRRLSETFRTETGQEPYLKIGNKTYLSEAFETYVRECLDNSGHVRTVKEQTELEILREEVERLRNENKELRDELRDERKHSRDLSDKLSELTDKSLQIADQAQQLEARGQVLQDKVLAALPVLEEKSDTTESSEKKKGRFLSKLFKA